MTGDTFVIVPINFSPIMTSSVSGVRVSNGGGSARWQEASINKQVSVARFDKIVDERSIVDLTSSSLTEEAQPLELSAASGWAQYFVK